MRFLHSADWQLGARFSQFGAKGVELRRARLATLLQALKLARDRSVDAFIVAGDLFEDNQVEESLIGETLDLFAQFPSLPIFILPGNHDPCSGPDSIWERRSFTACPSHVRVFRRPEAVACAEGFIIASPLRQKVSTIDPSLALDSLSRRLPDGAIKVGVTHGAMAIPGNHQPQDFPIALNAASRAGLDYLAVGHWHNWQLYDNDRIVMPGTPEPDNFEQTRSGYVALVEIDESGRVPRVEQVRVAGLSWKVWKLDVTDGENFRKELSSCIREAGVELTTVVARLEINGSNCDAVAMISQIREQFAPAFCCQIQDRTSQALTPIEIESIQKEHPLLAQVLSDISAMENALGTTHACAPSAEVTLSVAEFQDLLARGKIDLREVRPLHLAQARSELLTLFQKGGS